MARLNAVSPLAVLQRGYAIVTDARTDTVLTTATAAAHCDRLHIRFANDRLTVTIAPNATAVRTIAQDSDGRSNDP